MKASVILALWTTFAAQGIAAPLARSNAGSLVARGDDADDTYHTITPHNEKRGDDADDTYHTITPHERRGDDADDTYHTITPHENKKRGDDADDTYHTITPHENKKRGDDAVSWIALQ
ncbi:hypothetical protein F5B19DRAFT_498102 [Rostrohypoxylon terebratum]|nr:hypothetical protein F5B19DRAFT_498102 [Rostrohypoxylon terebratum]